MTGNELKQLVQRCADKDGLHEDICQAILDRTDLNSSQPISNVVIEDVLTHVEVLYKLKEFNFAEFNDRKFADWKRVRSAIEHENTLTNHRLTWLFSSQAFLITSYTLAFIQWGKNENIMEVNNVYPTLLLVIASFGIVLCFYIWFAVTAAVAQLRKLDDWWHGCREIEMLGKAHWQTTDDCKNAKEQLISEHPPIQGEVQYHRLEKVVNVKSIPWLFIIAWICLMLFSVLLRSKQLGDTISAYWREILIVILFIAIPATWWITRIRSR